MSDPGTTGATEIDGGLRVLQRVVLPVDRDLDVLKLYVEGEIGRGAEAFAAEAAAESAAESGGEGGDIVGRRSVVVPVGRRVSFATYFNAFPASYWRRWTSVDEVFLRVRVRGQATVIVYRSSSKGHVSRVASVRVDSDDAHEETFRLTLSPFIDGGWYWMDVLAGERDAVLERADWCAEPGHVRQGRVSLGITTFNRPSFCVDQLVALAAAPEALDIVDEIFVVDQGNQKVRDDGRYAAAAEGLGHRLRLIEQPNLGGSGGFSRAMDETLRSGTSDYVLLLDDDVVTETEGILRAVAFGDFARTPTVVGGHMFNLFVRSQLHAYGEVIAKYRWWWEEAEHTRREHDFALPPAQTLDPDAKPKTSSGGLRQDAVACTAASTSTTTAGGCASSPPTSSARSACRCRCSSSGTTPSTASAPARPGSRRCRCPAWPPGTSPGRTRTTPSTGRRTSTSGTGSSPRCCTRRTSGAATW
ncbi:hypothetical protein BJF79_37360 [Actinomadura sp. CNU-125]|nr:hypothetical protein BJF79_37360 [Actinomadura sp. CNU-125]